MGIVGGGCSPECPLALGASGDAMRPFGLTGRGERPQGTGRGLYAEIAVWRGAVRGRLLGGKRARPAAGAIRVGIDRLGGKTR